MNLKRKSLKRKIKRCYDNKTENEQKFEVETDSRSKDEETIQTSLNECEHGGNKLKRGILKNEKKNPP